MKFENQYYPKAVERMKKEEGFGIKESLWWVWINQALGLALAAAEREDGDEEDGSVGDGVDTGFVVNNWKHLYHCNC